MKPLKFLDEDALRKLVLGATLFGGGGGGAKIEGEKVVDIMASEGDIHLPLVPLDEMEETEDGKEVVSTMVASLGSPIATKGKTFIEEGISSVRGMVKAAAQDNKLCKYIYSGEQGGGNTLLPVYVASYLNMPLLDVDASGRAVPEMNTGLQPIYDVPTSPMVLGSGANDTITVRTADPCDSVSCEKIARYLCQAYDMGIGFCAWLMNKKQHEHSAIGQISLSVAAGEILMNSTKEDLVRHLVDGLGADRNVTPICESGTIEAIDIDVAGGFDTGVTTIKGNDGKICKVLFQNESLVAYRQDEAVATVPGIITMVDLDPEEGYDHPVPVSNSEIYVGEKVALFHIDAAEAWYATELGYGCWEEILSSAGYRDVRKEVRP